MKTGIIEQRRLTLDGSPGLATNCYIVGNGSRADVIWSSDDFETICDRLHNGNVPDNFLLAYRHKNGLAKFAKARRGGDRKKHVHWAFDSITGRAKVKTGLGAYPNDGNGCSYWAALDFDAHNQNERSLARERALKAFALLVRNADLWLILGTSGASGGWHLHIFTAEKHPCADWARLLREVSDKIGVPIQKGSLEIFPSDERGGCGIRVPGTWNPKDDSFGLIFVDSATQRLKALESIPKKKTSLCTLVGKLPGQETASLPNGKNNQPDGDFYRGEFGEWRSRFAINAPRSRHDKLSKLVGTTFFQCGKDIARRNAEAQYREAQPVPATPLIDHLAEFDQLWGGLELHWRAKLTSQEGERFNDLTTDNERHAFRLFRNWQQQSDEFDFYIHCKSLGRRLGITLAGASRMRLRFCSLGILRETAPYVRHILAGRYVWLLPLRERLLSPETANQQQRN